MNGSLLGGRVSARSVPDYAATWLVRHLGRHHRGRFAPIMPYVLLVLILIFRPDGPAGDPRHMSELSLPASQPPLPGRRRKAQILWGCGSQPAIVLLLLPKIFPPPVDR